MSYSATKKRKTKWEFDFAAMESVCTAKIEDFYGITGAQVVKCPRGNFTYIDNGANVLAVAHLDTVQASNHFVRSKHKGMDVVYNAKLDDRLGVYLIGDVLPKLGCKYDILLTEGEESCDSTAQWFLPPEGKQYNWMFSFDRMGTDVVMYQYERAELRRMLNKYGFWVGHGSYSDIAELGGLGCAGFNFGTGYYDNHALDAYCVLGDVRFMVNCFKRFYREQADKRFEFAPAKPKENRRQKREKFYAGYTPAPGKYGKRGKRVDYSDKLEDGFAWWLQDDKDERAEWDGREFDGRSYCNDDYNWEQESFDQWVREHDKPDSEYDLRMALDEEIETTARVVSVKGGK